MTTAPGRPRDRRIDRAVLAATAELLVEVGYADLTIATVAERAGTTKPAVYRRWRSKARLVHEAAFPVDDRMEVPHTSALDEDLRTMVRTVVAVFSDPVARAALPGLMGEIAADPTLHAALLERFQAGPIGSVRVRLAAAVAEGQARPGVDPDAVIEAIGGTTLLALLIRGDGDLGEAWVEHTTTMLLEGIAQ